MRIIIKTKIAFVTVKVVFQIELNITDHSTYKFKFFQDKIKFFGRIRNQRKLLHWLRAGQLDRLLHRQLGFDRCVLA